MPPSRQRAFAVQHLDSRSNRTTRQRPAVWRVLAAAGAAALLASACGLLSSDTTDTTTTTAMDDDMSMDDSNPSIVTAATPTTVAGDAMSGTDEEPEGPSVSTESKLSTAGLGPIQIGHSLEDARTAAGALLIAVPGGTDSCRYYTVQNGPEGVRFLAVNSEIVRVDIDSGPITTISGYGIGSTRSQIVEAFGDRIEDGPGLAAIQYVPVDTPDIDKRVVWEVDEAGAVTSLRSGRLPHIEPRVACTG
ncbi:hypothetical protein [Candidatus Poriferisodalis sp.]|uniref:hypothetical protein n=1 Tax=Candidatus Poriferisodalis sp. TaxID=3101277 RepID=UPI003B012FE3